MERQAAMVEEKSPEELFREICSLPPTEQKFWDSLQDYVKSNRASGNSGRSLFERLAGQELTFEDVVVED